ncbi:MAG: gamma carbonic anhydrase family protein [Burkholderiales bacterium]|nr:gamma carbonic anhydrase family protein [Burkholderiales bacterium]
MPVYAVGPRVPQFRSARHFIAPGARVIGSAVIGDGASVWFGAIVRADNEIIELGDEVNIQDGAVLHADPGFPLRLARGVSVGHLAMLHGSTIGENTLIGINAVVLNGCVIGRNCIIGANALLPEGRQIPDNSLVVGSPGKVVREVTDADAANLRRIAASYRERGAHYLRELREIAP